MCINNALSSAVTSLLFLKGGGGVTRKEIKQCGTRTGACSAEVNMCATPPSGTGTSVAVLF